MTEEEADTKCLFCRASVDNDGPLHSKQFPNDNQQSLRSTFDELCSLLRIEFPIKWASWDFGEEPFPFCASCHREIVTVCDLSDQIRVFHKSIQAIIVQLSSATLESESKDIHDKGGSRVTRKDDSPGLKNLTKPSDKYEFFRHSIIKCYAPNVILQPLGNLELQNVTRRIKRSFSPENENTEDAEYPCWDQEDSHLSGAFALSSDEDTNFEPSPSSPAGQASDSDSEQSPVCDDNVSGDEDYSSNSRISKSARGIKAGPSSATAPTGRPRMILDTVDEDTKTYAINGIQFRESARGFKCFQCLKTLAVPHRNRKTGRFDNIRIHIKNVHAGEQPLVRNDIEVIEDDIQVLDEAAKIYSISGIKIQKVDAGFQCMKCLKISKPVNKAGFKGPFGNIRLHVNAVHIGNVGRGKGRGRKSQVTLVDEATKTYTIFGLKFKQEGELFRCLVCQQMIRTCRQHKTEFFNMKIHMLKMHVRGQRPDNGLPFEDLKTNNFWDDFHSTSNPEAEGPKSAVSEEQEDPTSDCLPDSTLKVVDADKKVFSVFNFKFRELEDGYECGTCCQILTFHVNVPGKKRYPRHKNVKNHIRKLHFEPKRRKSGVVKVLDESIKAYEYEGIVFQEIDGQYKCSECSKLCPISKKKAFTYKYESIRNHIWTVHKITGYAPNVTLQPLGNLELQNVTRRIKRSFSPKNENTEDLKYPCEDKEKDFHLSEAFGLSSDEDTNFEPSPSSPAGQASDSESEQSPVCDDSVSEDEDYSSRSRKSKRARGMKATAPVCRPRMILETVDEDTKTYAINGIQFQESAKGFKCLQCFKTVAVPHKKASRFENIRRHIKNEHAEVEPLKRDEYEVNEDAIKVLDEAAKTYSISGIKIQKVDAGFQCMKCLKICKAVNKAGFKGPFQIIRLHVNAVHIGNVGRGKGRGRKSQVTLVDETTKTYTIFGLKFKQDGDMFRCLLCQQMIRTCRQYKTKFHNMKMHMIKMHVRAQRPDNGLPFDDSKTNNFWDDFHSTSNPKAVEAPKSRALTAGEEQEEVSTTEKTNDSNIFKIKDEPGDDGLNASQVMDPETKRCSVDYCFPDSTLKVVDADKKVFSVFNFKFRELEDGYECGTCCQILTFHVNEPGKHRFPPHKNVQKHIRRLHFEPERRKSGVVKVLDESTTAYEYEGIVFQEIDGQYKCLDCSELCPISQKKALTYKYESIRNHIWTVHKITGKRFKTNMIHREEKMYTHNDCEFKQTDKGLECLLCHSVHKLALDMMDHIESEHPEPVTRKCPFCPYTYNKWEHFKNHMKLHGPEVVCHICGKSVSRGILPAHLGRHKRSETRHPCDQCDKSYGDKAGLKAHVRSAHVGLKPFICDQCGKAFTLRGHLDCHYITHTKERRFQCKQCEMAYPHSNGLRRHRMTAHEGYKFPVKFECQVCGKKFQFTATLKRHHTEVHLGIRPPPRKRIRIRKKKEPPPPPRPTEES